jgi:peptidoglycan hydrolase CwlO-like protein
METLMKAINDLLEEKNASITLLKWERDSLIEEKKRLERENAELRNDIEKYRENEANRV